MSDTNQDKPSMRFIAGDWGTSNLRLYLCESQRGQARILQTRTGPGVAQIKDDFENCFFNLTQDWLDRWPEITVILSGMIGSTIGWKEAPYLTCPVDAADISAGRLCFNKRGTSFSILAGLKTVNPLKSPDVMRGEELQLLGWLAANGRPQQEALFVLPGTHNKWVLCRDGRIENFLTSFTGELFALLRHHSVLISEPDSTSFDESVFLQGVQALKQLQGADLIHALFTTRAKQVLGEISGEAGLSYLSGLIIGADVKGALASFSGAQEIVIIGEPKLTQHYQLALSEFGYASQSCDPNAIASAGYQTVYNEIINNKLQH